MIYIFGVLIPIILLTYGITLHRIIGKNRDSDKLLWAFSAVAIIGVVIHMIIFLYVTRAGFSEFCDLTSRVLFSLQYTLEMFIGNTIIFKGEVMGTLKDYPILFFVYIPIYGMAVITSCFAIFHFISRWLHNRSWLRKHSKEATEIKTHIFIGCNSASEILANDIHTKHPDQGIIFIDLPEEDENIQGVSVIDIISRFFKDSKEKEVYDKYVVLKAGKGMEELKPWLENKDNKVYILSDSQESNMSILEKLWEHKDKFECTIYCHAKKEGLVNRYDSITDIKDRIKFIDSSYLAVEYLKKHNTGELLPVKFVDIAKKDGKENLGYVTSDFNCAVIGFGETGKEAVKFLYEFGAFPDKANVKAPFKCHIFDKNIDKELGEFGIDLRTLRSPEAEENEFILHSCEIGSIEFRSEMLKLINELNYIVVCLGNDDKNIEVALNIADFATLEGRNTGRNFCIAVKQAKLSKLNEDTLRNANATYNKCLHPFGMMETIWKNHIISNELMDNDASRFFESYTTLSAAINKKLYPDYPVDTWEERKKKSCSENYCYADRCDAKRKIAQDYSNCLHVETKRVLCKGSNVKAKMICEINDNDKHCDGDYAAILEHLAVCEHLRWEASHLMLGYRPTDGGNKADRKLHNCIKPFSKLHPDKQHYDWLVVKNSIGEAEQKPQSERKESYIPKPIDTSDVVLPKQLDGLIEQMSENVHEVWAESRMSQGWTYGKERSDALKQHPCLVPYEELPEEEKAYDRDTALGTLKLIIKLGFRISKKNRFA